MNDEEKRRNLEERVIKAQAAKQLWENDLFQESLAEMESDVMATMRRLQPDDIKGLETCWRELRAVWRHLDKVKRRIDAGSEAESVLQRFFKKK